MASDLIAEVMSDHIERLSEFRSGFRERGRAPLTWGVLKSPLPHRVGAALIPDISQAPRTISGNTLTHYNLRIGKARLGRLHFVPRILGCDARTHYNSDQSTVWTTVNCGESRAPHLTKWSTLVQDPGL